MVVLLLPVVRTMGHRNQEEEKEEEEEEEEDLEESKLLAR